MESVASMSQDLCHHSDCIDGSGLSKHVVNAEQLLHEAQYAFNSISFGESPENRRNAARARSLAKKLIHKYPGTTEAYVSRSILRRLGDDSYAKRFDHSHSAPERRRRANKHRPHVARSSIVVSPEFTTATAANGESTTSLDWIGLAGWLVRLPKPVVAVAVFFGIFLFGLLGPFLLLPLLAFVLIVGPLRHTAKGEKRRQIDELIVTINKHIESSRQG